MKADKTACDYDLRGGRVGYINTTSTCDCALHTCFACQCQRTRLSAEAKTPPKQKLAA